MRRQVEIEEADRGVYRSDVEAYNMKSIQKIKTKQKEREAQVYLSTHLLKMRTVLAGRGP